VNLTIVNPAPAALAVELLANCIAGSRCQWTRVGIPASTPRCISPVCNHMLESALVAEVELASAQVKQEFPISTILSPMTP
jgi:hypothetical protein